MPRFRGEGMVLLSEEGAPLDVAEVRYAAPVFWKTWVPRERWRERKMPQSYGC